MVLLPGFVADIARKKIFTEILTSNYSTKQRFGIRRSMGKLAGESLNKNNLKTYLRS